MSSPLEISLKKRLQAVAKERQLTPAVVWQNVVADRFLMRLCKSRFNENFILKGGILLAKHLNIGRETKDLDFSVESLRNDEQELLNVIREIVDIDVDDGFKFRNVKVDTLNHFHVNYPGAQVRVDVSFGKNQSSLFIDLGFGDHVSGQEQNILLLANSTGSLFEDDITVRCYPLEFVFAEKLETLIYRGAESSRMKDYHDLLSMTEEGIQGTILDKENALQAIKIVFKHRNTPLQLPISFEKASTQLLQQSWQRYRSSITSPARLPESIEEVITAINSWGEFSTKLLLEQPSQL